MLRRLGNKTQLAAEINSHFPKHKAYIELFFGAGGMFFNKPPAKFNFVNDLDDDVVNLFMLNDRVDELVFQLKRMPISSSLFKHWRHNKEIDPVRKALRFLLLSNFSYMGKGETLRFSADNPKKMILKSIDDTFNQLENVKIMNYDFRQVLEKISFSKTVLSKDETFIYLDPEYFGTESNYNTPQFTFKDIKSCFELMSDCGIRCAMSGFSDKEINKLIQKHNFNSISIKERRTLKNRNNEILITNYDSRQLEIDFNNTNVHA